MSLDLYLRYPNRPTVNYASEEIFVRRGGQTVSISREEWDRLHPGVEPVTLTGDGSEQDYEEVFHANITHNLTGMALEAGIYNALWRPYRLHPDYYRTVTNPAASPAEEYKFEAVYPIKAIELIAPLAKGIKLLLSEPEAYKALNPENGWGSYEGLLRFAKGVLNACLENPEADVIASR